MCQTCRWRCVCNVVVEKHLPLPYKPTRTHTMHIPVSIIACVVLLRWTYVLLYIRTLQCVRVWLSYVKMEGMLTKLGLAPNASNQGLQHFRPPLWRRWGWGWYSHFVAKARWDDTCWWTICDFSSWWEWRFFSYGNQDSQLPEISVASACLLFRNGDILSPGITPAKLRTRIWGNFSFKDGFITALVMTLDRGENRSRRLVTRADMLMSRSMNIEVFGIEDGHYLAQAGRRVKRQKKSSGAAMNKTCLT